MSKILEHLSELDDYLLMVRMTYDRISHSAKISEELFSEKTKELLFSDVELKEEVLKFQEEAQKVEKQFLIRLERGLAIKKKYIDLREEEKLI